MKLPIAHVDIRLSVHATEDMEKARRAVCNLLPEDHVGEISFKTDALKGHYGNPITLLSTRIEDQGIISAFVENLSRRLNDQDKHEVLRSLDRFLEKNDLYLRLDKQAALGNELKLRQDDPVHIRIHFKTSDEETIVNLCRGLGLTP